MAGSVFEKPYGTIPALVVVFLTDDVHHVLEFRCPCFLTYRIINVEGLEQFIDKVMFPTHLLIILLQLGRVGELATRFYLSRTTSEYCDNNPPWPLACYGRIPS